MEASKSGCGLNQGVFLCEVLQLECLPQGLSWSVLPLLYLTALGYINWKFKVSKLLIIQMGPVIVLMTKKFLAMYPECFPLPGESFPYAGSFLNCTQ